MPTIQNRRATKSQWSLLNPVLAAGEVGVELGDPLKFKMGNGLTPWNDLKYFVDETVTGHSAGTGALLSDQPARRLFDKTLANVGTRPIIVPWLTASTGEGSVADNDKTIHILLQKMLQASYNPPGISGGYSLKVRAWPKTGSTGEVVDLDTKKLAVLNTGATATHTSFHDCTGIDIHYPCGPGLGSWTLKIDTGSPVTINADSPINYTAIYRSPVQPRSSHTFQVAALSDNAQLGLTYIRDQDERAGVRLYNFGRAGGATTQFLGSETSTWARLDSLVPDAAIVMLGHNDMGNGLSTTQMKTNFGLLVDRIQQSAGRPVWVGVLIQHSTDPRWPAYATAIEEFCASRPNIVTAHSFREFFANNVTDAATTGEFHTDNLHLNNEGHRVATYAVADSMRLPAQKLLAVKPATEALPSIDPAVPDITTDLLARFTFDLGLAEGASVASVMPNSGRRGLPLADQTTVAKQPTYLANALNGHGALRFTRANSQSLRYAQGASIEINTMPATLVVVGRRTTTGVSGNFINGGVGQDSVSRGLSIESESAAYQFRGGSVGGGGNNVGTADTNWHIMVSVADGANSRVHLDSVTVNGTLTDVASASMQRMTVGANSANTANFLDGDIADIFEFGRALTVEQVSYLISTLKARYALT